MTEYENEQYELIKAWQNAEPGIVSQAMDFCMKPIVWIAEKAIPQKAIEGVLVGANAIAETLTDQGDVLRDAKVQTIDELRSKDLKISDELANSVHNWALSIAAAEGGSVGLLGFAGLAIDIPALITMCLRVIHKIGVCYGFVFEGDEGRQIVMSVMSAAGANTMKEKAAAIAFLQQVNVLIATTSWKKLSESKAIMAVAITAIRTLAKQLGINITKRKAAQAVPLIGATVGAAMNAALLNDVAWAARRTFQKMWLCENHKISQQDI